MDRNLLELSLWGAGGASLSARRAWIEMTLMVSWFSVALVALRKESVDRNVLWVLRKVPILGMSLSARRAWIEMYQS